MSLTAKAKAEQLSVSAQGQRPFSDETELRRLINGCHDRILFQTGHDPAKAFDEVSQILMVKLFDEQSHPQAPRFIRQPGESVKGVAERMRQLLRECAADQTFGRVIENTFDGRPSDARIDLDDETISFVVDRLEGYSLSATGDLLRGADVKGVVFETMVGSTFRGNLGAYFTPRNIAEFMVRLLAPTPRDRIFDPACGSGGFLIMVLKYLREQVASSGSSVDLRPTPTARGFDGSDSGPGG
jgi:type I restriction enzyme M protein